MNKKTLGKIALGVALCGGAVAAYSVLGWRAMGGTSGLKLDLARPDALIATRSLAALPRDLLAIPLLRDVLREDFVFYYEQNEDKLGLKGTLRRIAYEHELNWGDELIRAVLNEPAEVALWRDADGSLKHFALAVTRTSFTRLLEETGKVALKDSQMTLAGSLKVEGSKVPVYALAYANKRSLLFAAHGKRMVILSHPGMVYGGETGTDGDPDAEAVVAGLLSGDPAKQRPYHAQFKLDPKAPDGHSVAVKADFVSFGYQPFFGGLEALRFDFDKAGWRSSALLDAAKLKAGGYDSSALWPVLPHDPAACFSLPANWASMQQPLERLSKSADTPLLPLLERLSGPAAADPLFASLFKAAVGRAKSGEITKREGDNGAVLWQRTVATALGEETPTLALSGRTVVFSSDAKLVEQVLTVMRKQAPAASDRLKDASRTVGLIAPAALSELIQKEAFDALPNAAEPVLRGAADAHLVPRLKALKQYPPYRLVLKAVPTTGSGWQPIEWQAIGP